MIICVPPRLWLLGLINLVINLVKTIDVTKQGQIDHLSKLSCQRWAHMQGSVGAFQERLKK